MALSIWTRRSGYKVATSQERSIINQPLPVSYDSIDNPADVNFSLISGKLPTGLRIEGDQVVGTPFEVPRTTDFEFVLRASYNNQLADRTFFWTIEGADEPTWETPAGSLPIGANNQYFILDNTYVDFQLVATDFDTATGQTLKYFQPKDGGDLPPGLILTEDGRLVGWIQPTLAIPETAGNGFYDTGVFDGVAYDFGYRPSNGYDSYLYDSVNYDYSISSLPARKLNRYYEFLVTVTDGDTSSTRKFKVFVVGDDYFRADTVAIGAGNGVFTVDGTYVRAPIWVTPKNLGMKRANNYLTLKLDTYDGLELGPISYKLDYVNPLISGYAYTSSPNENKIGKNLLRIKTVSETPTVGQYFCLEDYVAGAGSTVYKIVNVTEVTSTEYVLTTLPSLSAEVGNNKYLELGDLSVIPPGLQLDPGTAEVFGVVPYQPAITKEYSFTVTATRYSDKEETASSKRTFSVTLIGEIDSVMSWTSPEDLGSIGANYVSTLSVKATSTITESVILYTLTSGSLPPGLTLDLDGELVGKVSQFESESNLGLITFDNNTMLFDNGTTTVDRQYTFTIQARDILSYSAISRTFVLKVDTPNDRLYSNMYVKPLLKKSQRDIFREFITDSSIFTASSVYRPGDPNFGVQDQLKMLVFAGIETTSAGAVAAAVGLNHKPKKFKLGDIKKAVAKNVGTNDVVYEVIYLEVIDPLENGADYLPSKVITKGNNRNVTVDQNNQYYTGPFTLDTQYWNAPDPFSVTADSSGVFADDPATTVRFPASVSLWRERIKALGLKERNYLPLWMRSIQPGEVTELDYVKAIPLCYCKPGTADDILLTLTNRLITGSKGDWISTRYYLVGDTVNYKNFTYTCTTNNIGENPVDNPNSWTVNFNFNQIDYVIDRYIIDSVTGYSADKYIAFKNDRTTIS